METSNLSDAEFKILIIKMLNELRGRIDRFSQNFNKEIGNIKINIKNKKNQSKVENTIIEIKNTLIGNNSRLDEVYD